MDEKYNYQHNTALQCVFKPFLLIKNCQKLFLAKGFFFFKKERFWNMYFRIIYICIYTHIHKVAVFLVIPWLVQARDHTTQPLLPFQQELFISRDTSLGSFLCYGFPSFFWKNYITCNMCIMSLSIYTYTACYILAYKFASEYLFH